MSGCVDYRVRRDCYHDVVGCIFCVFYYSALSILVPLRARIDCLGRISQGNEEQQGQGKVTCHTSEDLIVFVHVHKWTLALQPCQF